MWLQNKQHFTVAWNRKGTHSGHPFVCPISDLQQSDLQQYSTTISITITITITISRSRIVYFLQKLQNHSYPEVVKNFLNVTGIHNRIVIVKVVATPLGDLQVTPVS